MSVISLSSAYEVPQSLAQPLPYDSLAYLRALEHLGPPETIAGLPWPVLIRSIPGSARCDALGPWPYGSAPEARHVPAALNALRDRGLVTLTAFLRPDQAVDAAALRQAGLDCTPLKDHFIFSVTEPQPAHSKKTRYNLAVARRAWSVQPIDLGADWPALADWHQQLAARRMMSRMADVPPIHFERLTNVPGATVLGAFDQAGLAAALVVLVAGGGVHFHAVLGDARAYRDRAFYALYADALERWGGDHLICMGGTPAGPDGLGVEKFKRRFATSTRPVTMISAILDPTACAQLAAQRGAPGYFPPYRTPAD